jgi:hypothetical protein
MCWTPEHNMKKPISTRVHGLIDYSWAAAASALSTRVNGATATARLLRRASTTATATSLLTNYEAGAVHLLPMKGHLAMDVALCSALLAAPLYLPTAERRYAAVPLLLGGIGLITSLLTESRSPTELDEEFGGFISSRDLSEIADQDPERLHLE